MLVDSTDRPALLAALAAAGSDAVENPAAVAVVGSTAEAVGRIALTAGVPLTMLTVEQAGLENVFLELVGTTEPTGVES